MSLVMVGCGGGSNRAEGPPSNSNDGGAPLPDVGSGGSDVGTTADGAPCGAPGQACCGGNSCNGGGCCIPVPMMNAGGGRMCVGAGQACMGTNVAGTCGAGSCTDTGGAPCGAVGQICCGGAEGGGGGGG